MAKAKQLHFVVVPRYGPLYYQAVTVEPHRVQAFHDSNSEDAMSVIGSFRTREWAEKTVAALDEAREVVT